MSERRLIPDEHLGHKFGWNIRIFPTTQPVYPRVQCTTCGGSGRIGDHFKAIDDPQPCWSCGSTGLMVAPHDPWKPTPPPELMAALRKVWFDYLNKQENESFALTMQENSDGQA